MAQISTVFLFGLRINPASCNIELHCTKNFFLMIRTHLGEMRGSILRVGSFSFLLTADNFYEACPTEHGDAAVAEARAMCPRILTIYRSAITFEKVFGEPGSYETWMAFNHRPPTSRQLGELARSKGIRVPFLEFPYTSPLLPDNRLEANLAASLRTTAVGTTAQQQVYHSRHEVRGVPKHVKPVNKVVATDKVAALANHFKRV